MKISTYLTLALALTGLIVFSIYGWFHLGTELEVRRASFERNTLLVGRALQAAIEDALRDRQLADILDTLDSLRRVDPQVEIMAWNPSGQVLASSTSSHEQDALELEVLGLTKQALEPVLRYDDPEEPRRMVLGLPLMGPDNSVAGFLLLTRPLTRLQNELKAARAEIVLSVMLLVLATSITGHLVGKRFIGRPLKHMAVAMDRVRIGDLSQELEVSSNDEISSLARQFNLMLRDLRHARKQLEEEAEGRQRIERGMQEVGKLITIGQLSAGLAHEIGSPLQILNGRARMLQRRSDDPDTVRRNAEILVEQTERITRIVEQLLHFARRRPAQMIRIRLGEAVGAVVHLLEIEARRRKVTLTLKSGDELPWVLADPDQIQQITLNLITNALAATPPGGTVTVTLRTQDEAAPDGLTNHFVVLEVRDSGRGIPPEILPRLGEPFFTTRSLEGGTGLGLSVVRSIVRDHHGELAIESQPEQGSRFTVFLPVYSSPPIQDIAS